MGRAKNQAQEYYDRGYGPTDKYVCANCFGDKYLKTYIRKKGHRGKCSFCKENGKPAVRNVLPLEDVMPVIMKVVKNDYLPALDNAIYDSEDKVYLDKVFDPWTFVTNELDNYLECAEGKLLLELENILLFEDRVSKYNWISRQEEDDMREWDHFCELVKASKLSAEQIISECGRKRATPNLVAIKNCLDKIYLYVVDSIYMTSVIRPHTTILRCGTHIKSTYMKDYDVAAIPSSLIGTVPALATSDNRMSEIGDMMFYGAFQKYVALAEIEAQPGDTVTVGKFHTNKQIKVLDLSKLTHKDCPSIFDIENRGKRSQWHFIHEFVKRISGQVDDDDQKFYKPTQVFTKYIQRKTKLAGIIYPSSKFENERICGGEEIEKCIVLFVDNKDCIEEGDPVDKNRVQLIMEPNPEQYIIRKGNLNGTR